MRTFRCEGSMALENHRRRPLEDGGRYADPRSSVPEPPIRSESLVSDLLRCHTHLFIPAKRPIPRPCDPPPGIAGEAGALAEGYRLTDNPMRWARNRKMWVGRVVGGGAGSYATSRDKEQGLA